MKRIQKNLFFLPDSAAVVFKVFPSESLQGSSILRDYIELAGGMCLEDDEDDPFAIPIVDLHFLHDNNMKGFKKPNKDSRDYFKSDYVYDCYLNNKMQDLNQYKMSHLCDTLHTSQYDANEIARREVQWKDVIPKISNQRAILQKTSKKNRTQSSQVCGTVIPLLPSQPDPQSSGGAEHEDNQIMHPSQNSDDDNNKDNNEFDEIKDSSFESNINIGKSKSMSNKSIPGDDDDGEDTGDEIRLLEKDAESIQDTPQDNQMDQNIIIIPNNNNDNSDDHSDNNNNNNFNEDIQSVNGSDIEDNVVGDELPCTSKSLNNSNNEKESNIINNNNSTASNSPVAKKPVDDDSSSDEEKNNRYKTKKRKQTNGAHSSKKKRKRIARSPSSSSSEDEKEKKSRRKAKSPEIVNSNDDSSSDEAKSDFDNVPKKKQMKVGKPKKKKAKVEQELRRGAYSYEESVSILEFINKYKYHNLIGGVLLWRKMTETGKFYRTDQSLKEHFRKTVLKNLEFYGCSKENRKKFRDAEKNRKRTPHKTKMFSQDFQNMLDAELSNDEESEKQKKTKKKKNKSAKAKPRKQDSDDDD